MMSADIITFTPKRRDEFRLAAEVLVKANLDFFNACWGISPKLPEAKILPFPQKQKLLESKR